MYSLGPHLPLDVVSAEDWLLQLHVLEGDEGEGEGLHGVVLLLCVEDHPVRGQVQAALLLPLELDAILTILMSVLVSISMVDHSDYGCNHQEIVDQVDSVDSPYNTYTTPFPLI